jgi:hypothetical protein
VRNSLVLVGPLNLTYIESDTKDALNFLLIISVTQVTSNRSAAAIAFSGGTEDLILDVDKMLAELRLEREQIEEAILTLERLARGRGRRRGRPPTWLKDAAAAVSAANEGDSNGTAPEPKRRGRPPGSKTKHTASAEA